MNDLDLSAASRLFRLLLLLLVFALASYGAGLAIIYVASCQPAVNFMLAPLGIVLMLVASGVSLAHAALKRNARSWAGALIVLLSAVAMIFLFYILAFVRCSGV